MSNSANRPSSFPSRDALIESLQQIIGTISPQLGQANGAQKLDIRALERVEQQLNNILPMLQFELLDAEDAREWDTVDQLTQAIDACKDALNTVRAAILRSTVIPLQDQDLVELRKLKDQIDAASRTQGQFRAVFSVANFVRRLLLPGLIV